MYKNDTIIIYGKETAMTTVLFLVYTAVFAVSFFAGGDDIHTVIGLMSGLSVFYCFFRSFYLTARLGHYRKKYLGALLAFLVVVPYALCPARVASVIAYTCIALWHYIIPALRLLALRLFYVQALKKACRGRNHRVESLKGGGLTVRTPAKVYDIRIVGALRRKGLITPVDGATYTAQWIPTYVADRPDRMVPLLRTDEGAGAVLRRLLVGCARTRRVVWSEALAGDPNAERVLLFLPGLCEWRFTAEGEQARTNGSVVHGVRYFDADAFIEKLQ